MLIMLIVTRQFAESSVDYAGNETAVYIFAFVLGIATFKEPFCLFIQNGVSRKSIFAGQLVTFIVSALIMAILSKALLLLGWILELIEKRYRFTGFFEQLYSARYAGNTNGMQVQLEGFLFNFCFFAAFAAAGYFIAALYYRMNKGLKIAVSVGVPVLFAVVLPIIDSLLVKPFIYDSIFGFISFALGFSNGANPYYAVVSSLLGIALLSGLSWLLMRRSVIKS
jgi:hypothetical protein